MFNLEHSIAEWRRRMLAVGVKNPGVLDELESHLREDIEQQTKTGLPAQQASEIAMTRIGHAAELKIEFNKAGKMSENTPRNHNRVYMATLVVFLIACFCQHYWPTPGLDEARLKPWMAQGGGKFMGNGLLGMYASFTGGGFEKSALAIPGIMTPIFPFLGADLILFYSMAIGLTFCSRILNHRTRRPLTCFLNLALLPIFPFGTAIGIYGLIVLGLERKQYV